jgi:hypothetical protein
MVGSSGRGSWRPPGDRGSTRQLEGNVKRCVVTLIRLTKGFRRAHISVMPVRERAFRDRDGGNQKAQVLNRPLCHRLLAGRASVRVSHLVSRGRGPRIGPPPPEGLMVNEGKWADWYQGVAKPWPYGDTTTYEIGAGWLAGFALIEDWGCARAGCARWFRRTSIAASTKLPPPSATRSASAVGSTRAATIGRRSRWADLGG